ncbi:MAG TPA: ABC transporter permease [Acidobacteriota bacterium]|nr:ABC transporter permease [Acidobacteriota bacterium]
MIENLGQDLRFALRTLRKAPTFTLLAVLTLALGIGANSAIFSIVNGVLLQPLPYAQDERIVIIHQETNRGGTQAMPFSVKEIEDYRAQNQTLQEVVEYHSMGFTIWGELEPHRVRTGVVSANFFDVLGVEPMMGRTFQKGEDQHGTPPILVFSYEYWAGRHGSDPDIIGKTFKVNDNIHEVVGVLPPLPQYPRYNDVYMPTSHCPTRSSQGFIDNRNARMMNVFALLKEGSRLEHAERDVAAVARRMASEHSESYPPESGFAARATQLKDELTREARPTFLILLAASGLVLLIACANVANLSLSRLLRREREMALRSALGAGRLRLLRQMITESSLVALGGGLLGLLVAYAGLDLLVDFAARFTPRAPEITVDGRVLLFTLLVSMAAGILFGALPALQPRQDLQKALSDGTRSSSGRGKQRLRQVLVVAQVGVSLVLLAGAGLMVRSFVKLQQVDAGFQPEQVLSMRVGLNFTKFAQSPAGVREARKAFMEKVEEEVRALPGVVSAGIVSVVPLNQQQGMTHEFNIEGRQAGNTPRIATHSFASPDYFRTVGIPLLRGRFFNAGDDAQANRVAIITHSLAQRHFPDQDPVGKRISAAMGDSDWITIVGVIGDIRQYGLDKGPADEIYVPFAQAPFSSRLVVRTAGDPSALAQSLISKVREIDPDQTVDSVQTLEEIRADSVAPARLTTVLTGLLSLLALLITAAGVTGVMALLVGQRTQEIGVRRALGAQSGDILRLVLGQGLVMVVVGCVLGMAGALVLGRFVESLLFNVSAYDPLTLASTSLILLLAALAACYVPARRALGVDPRDALHAE